MKNIYEGNEIINNLYNLEKFIKEIEDNNPIVYREAKQELEDYLLPTGPGGGYASLKKIEIMKLGITVVKFLKSIKGEQGVYDSLPTRLQGDLNHHLTYSQINDIDGAFLGEATSYSEMRIFPNLIINLPTDGGEDNDEYFLASVRRKSRLLDGILITLRKNIHFAKL